MRFLNTKDVGNCEYDPDFFEKEKQKEENKKKKENPLKKEKGGVESKLLGKISRCGSFWLTREGLSRLRWHAHTHTRARTHIGSVAHSPGMKNVAVAKGGDRERKGGDPNRRNVELSTALIVSRSGPMVWCTWVYGVLSRQGTRDQRVEEVERYTRGVEGGTWTMRAR